MPRPIPNVYREAGWFVTALALIGGGGGILWRLVRG
jgi:hypothetical protein